MENIKKTADQLDCIFYFIAKCEGKSVQLNSDVQKRICDKMKDILGVNFYGSRSGPSVNDKDLLKVELEGVIPEQVNFIIVDADNDEVSLLSQEQRNLFLERLYETSEKDTFKLACEIIEETEQNL